MRAVLHLGTTKTGTTAIQSTLERQRDALRARHVLYPLAPGERGPQTAYMIRAVMRDGAPGHAEALARRYGGMRTHANAARPGFDEALMREAHGMDAMVVSSESFWNQPGIAPAMAAYTARLADEVTLVVYLRRQDLHAASAYAQVVQHNGHAEPFRLHGPPRRQYLFHDRLAEWRAAFPRATILVRPYERGQMVDGDVVADFARHAGVPLDASDRGTRSNPSIDALSTAFLVRINRRLDLGRHPGRHEGLRLLRRVLERRSAERPRLGERPSGRVALGAASAAAYLEPYRAQNEAVARDYLGREDGVLFYEPVGSREDVLDPLGGSAAALDDVMDVCAAALEEAHAEIVRLRAALDGRELDGREDDGPPEG